MLLNTSGVHIKNKYLVVVIGSCSNLLLDGSDVRGRTSNQRRSRIHDAWATLSTGHHLTIYHHAIGRQHREAQSTDKAPQS